MVVRRLEISFRTLEDSLTEPTNGISLVVRIVRLESMYLALAVFSGLVSWLLDHHEGWGAAIGMFVGANLVAGFSLWRERRTVQGGCRHRA